MRWPKSLFLARNVIRRGHMILVSRVGVMRVVRCEKATREGKFHNPHVDLQFSGCHHEVALIFAADCFRGRRCRHSGGHQFPRRAILWRSPKGTQRRGKTNPETPKILYVLRYFNSFSLHRYCLFLFVDSMSKARHSDLHHSVWKHRTIVHRVAD